MGWAQNYARCVVMLYLFRHFNLTTHYTQYATSQSSLVREMSAIVNITAIQEIPDVLILHSYTGNTRCVLIKTGSLRRDTVPALW